MTAPIDIFYIVQEILVGKIKLFYCIPGWLGYMSQHIPLLALRLPDLDFCNLHESYLIPSCDLGPGLFYEATPFSHTLTPGPQRKKDFLSVVMCDSSAVERQPQGTSLNL